MTTHGGWRVDQQFEQPEFFGYDKGGALAREDELRKLGKQPVVWEDCAEYWPVPEPQKAPETRDVALCWPNSPNDAHVVTGPQNGAQRRFWRIA